MAKLQYKPYQPWEPPTVDTNVTELAIGGKAMKIQIRIEEHERMRMRNDVEYETEMKRRLATEMANFMLENNVIEFTSMQAADQLHTLISARCYVAPNETVKLLRIHKAIP